MTLPSGRRRSALAVTTAMAAVWAAAEAASTQSGSEVSDCVCQETWEHSCKLGNGEENIKTFRGCPTLSELQACNSDAQSRWCKTTEKLCFQQVHGEIDTGMFSYCDVTGEDNRKNLPEHNTDVRDWCKLSKFETDEKGKQRLLEYDLTPLQKPEKEDTYYDQPGVNYQVMLKNKYKHDNRDYFLNVCGPLVGYPDESNNANGKVAVYERVLSNTSTNHALARSEEAALYSLNDFDLRMTMKYGDGCSKGDVRETNIFFLCEDVGLGKPVFADEITHCAYFFLWATCAACPIGHPYRTHNCGPGSVASAKSTMSPATVLLIVVSVVFLLYCFCGCAYNRFCNAEKGMDQVPNSSFWKSCLDSLMAGPSACLALCTGGSSKPVQNYTIHQGLVDDDDDDEVDDDAEDALYDP